MSKKAKTLHCQLLLFIRLDFMLSHNIARLTLIIYLKISDMSQRLQCILKIRFPDILPTYKMPTRHFAYRHFAYQTLCLPDKMPTDIVPTRQSAYRTFCLPDILPTDILPTRHSAYQTFCLLTFCLLDIMPT